VTRQNGREPMLDVQSLFKLTYPMCITSSVKDGKYNGCIVNTTFQIVPEPVIMAMSVNRQCLTHEYITASGVFAVAVLAQEAPMPFIGRWGFRSGRDIDKFKHTDYRIGQTGAPIVLNYAVAVLEAEVIDARDFGTHKLFVGKVVTCESVSDSEPMTYAYYRDIKHGRTPKTAATYVQIEPEKKTTTGAKEMKKYKCLVCGYIYDPAASDPENSVQPGTAFEDLPDDWVCPECGAGKDEFEPVEE